MNKKWTPNAKLKVRKRQAFTKGRCVAEITEIKMADFIGRVASVIRKKSNKCELALV